MHDLVIVGGGPSGLAAAYEAVGRGAKAVVLERLDRVGGLSRTTSFEGSRFDVGPHRFFTKNQEVHALFVKMAAEDLLSVPRLTRIFYKNTYFNYPLTPLNALFGVGILSSISILSSYMSARAQAVYGKNRIENFEDWIVDHFGRRLFETFFKTYTEKVWGIPCTQIGADWASQRIKGLSLTTALVNALFKPKKNTVKTLIDEFVYPRLGAGQLYEKMAASVQQDGSSVMTNARVCRIRRDHMRVCAIEVEDAQRSVRCRGTLFSRERSPHRHDRNDVSECTTRGPFSLLRVTLSQPFRSQSRSRGPTISGQLDLRPLERSGHGAHRKLREFFAGNVQSAGDKSADCRIFLLSARSSLGYVR